MSEQTDASIAGGWLGTYAYKGALRVKPPVRFEATFAPPDGEGHFSGAILDDGGLGEATASGAQGGLSVHFTKNYHQAGHLPVSYEGTLSEEGRTMQGTWRINGRAHGIWDAHRLWSESPSSETEAQENELESVRELVRLG